MSSLAPQLKPMTAGDILDQAIRIYRHNFVPLVTIVAIISVPVILLQVVFFATLIPLSFEPSSAPDFATDPTSILGLGAITYLAAIIGAILAIFQNAALAWFVSERFLGRATTVRQAYGQAFRRWLSLLIAALLLSVAVFGLFLILFGAGFVPLIAVSALGASDTAAGALAGLAFLCLCVLFVPAFVVAIFLYTRWTFWNQAIVLEKYNSTGGLGRSWKLTKGTFWRVLGFNFILIVIVGAFAAGPIYLLSFVTIFLPWPALGVIIQTLASSLITMIMTPLQFAVLTVLFYDLKIRKEGFDLQFQMQDELPAALSPLHSGSTE